MPKKQHDWEAARRLHDEGKTLREINEATGIPVTTLHRRVKDWRQEGEAEGVDVSTESLGDDDGLDGLDLEGVDPEDGSDPLEGDGGCSDLELGDDLEGDAGDGPVDFDDDDGPVLILADDEDLEDFGYWD